MIEDFDSTDAVQVVAVETAKGEQEMSKLKIEKAASKVRRAPLKVTIDGSVADDLELMCEWSENDSSYLVNLLLGFAIAQSDDFQRYKADRPSTPAHPRDGEKSGSPAASKPQPATAMSSEKATNA
jgi:hypothetical protein